MTSTSSTARGSLTFKPIIEFANVSKKSSHILTPTGLAALVKMPGKNAILIVDFAKWRQAAGVPLGEACRLPLRPILTTAFAFVAGEVPLLIAHGAGAKMQRINSGHTRKPLKTLLAACSSARLPHKVFVVVGESSHLELANGEKEVGR